MSRPGFGSCSNLFAPPRKTADVLHLESKSCSGSTAQRVLRPDLQSDRIRQDLQRRRTTLQSVRLTNFSARPGSTSPFKHAKRLSKKQMCLPSSSPTIAVTCTNQGNPGYDFLVDRKLNLPLHVDRMLLHGVGCAGGLSILKGLRRKPARILAFACELCTPNVGHYLSIAERSTDSGQVNIAAALFSDAATAFVLCNEYACYDSGRGSHSSI